MDTNLLYYFASPYSHKDEKIQHDRYLMQGEIAASLIKEGFILLQPIEMCHNLSLRFGLPGGYEFWKRRDRTFIDRCEATIVCDMPGWKESIGVQDEIQYTKEQGKKAYLYNYGIKSYTLIG